MNLAETAAGTQEVTAPGMKIILAIIGSLLLLSIAAFCLFGFLATFEPTDTPGQFMAFRIAYGVIGIGCLAGIVALVVKAIRN